MSTRSEKAERFRALHVKGDPLILFNAWDAGSAKAIADAGAKAIATGSWSVAAASGFDDAESLPLDLALANAARVVAAVDLPVTIDFEGGYAEEPWELAGNMVRLAATGAVGCNFEDQVVGSDGLHAIDFQAERIGAVRSAIGPNFFINARTDIFLKARRDTHDDARIDAAIERARVYADADASGFFAPGLVDIALIARLCEGSPLPVNIMSFPGVPANAELAGAGVARISYGPGPYRLAMQALTEAARNLYS